MFQNIIKGSPRVREPATFIAHCEFIALLVSETIKKIKEKIPEFKIDEEEMKVAAQLHDIGYCFAKEGIFHPIIGGEFLAERGFPRIAEIIKGHTYALEALQLKGYKNLNPEDYRAKTWNHVLIDYASLHCGKVGERISPDEKFKRFRQERGEDFQKIIDLAEPRLREEVADVEELLKGNKKILLKYKIL